MNQYELDQEIRYLFLCAYDLIIRTMPTRMNIDPPVFNDVLAWLESYSAVNPKHIPKLRGLCQCPYFFAWAEGQIIKLRSHPDAIYREHVLTVQEWEAFRNYRSALNDVDKDKSVSYNYHPWTSDRAFYPAIPALSRAYYDENNQ